jgi:imidazolonepropionase-like amidohydrolase
MQPNPGTRSVYINLRISKALSTFLILSFCLTYSACRKSVTEQFVAIDEPLIALTHLRVIDGTGSPASEDQTIIIEAGRIKAIGKATDIQMPGNAVVIDLAGHTAIPGLVGMHDHLFYAIEGGKKYVSSNVSFPRLYLACGVTTIRTAGSFNLDGDVKTRQSIEQGAAPGPKIHLSSPYINRAADEQLEPQRINQLVNEWADKGVTWLKVYENIGGEELATIISAAHNRGLKVTGHLCAVGFREAAQLGIDNLEHGLIVDTEFYSKKTPDKCPERWYWLPELTRLDLRTPVVQEMIRDLVSRRIAITSTLAVFETLIGEKFQLDPRMKQALADDAYASCLSRIEQDKADPRWARIWEGTLKKEMEFEREFFKAGGLLLAGVDPTAWGGTIAGFGNQRQLELLVEAGFKPEEAIKIASANGAEFLGESTHIGTLEAGKQADIVIIRGNPASNIRDVRNVTIVFKDGVGYDSAKLVDSVKGQVGIK